MAALLITGLGFAAQIGASQPVEGRDFTVAKPAQPTAKDKVEVVEFFSYNSFGVETKLERSETLSRTFRIPSIPTMIIDGKYLVPIASNIDYGVQLATIDALIARARTEKKLPTSGK
jgi:thiol:disulfide interchange protein DsbA